MNNWILYLIQAASVFSILYLMYSLFLNRLTFHGVNRIVLLLLLPISIIIPLSNNLFPSIGSKAIEVPLFEHIDFSTINHQLQTVENPLIVASWNYSTLLIAIYWIVFSFHFMRIASTTRQLVLLKNKSQIMNKKDCKLVIANVPEIFSYFHWIFIPKDLFENYNQQIIEHEKTHIKLKHSWDVILSEIYIAFFWFNPLLYFYRKSLKSVHEFQADKGVLKTGVKVSNYMELLLKSLEVSKPNNLYNYFNQPLLKKRVIMMSKPKSSHISKLKYTLLLPVCTFLILAFTTPIVEYNNLKVKNTANLVSPPPSLFPVQNASKGDITSHFGKKGKRPKTKRNIMHTGIDIRAEIGTPVIATADGMINKASMEGDWGNLIVITHSDGYETWYAHLSGFNSSKNQKVRKGDVIGYVGTTGFSTGPHLHYEVKLNGKHLDPMHYLD